MGRQIVILDSSGRVVLPAEVQRGAGLATGDLVEFFAADDHLVLRRWTAPASYQPHQSPVPATGPDGGAGSPGSPTTFTSASKSTP